VGTTIQQSSALPTSTFGLRQKFFALLVFITGVILIAPTSINADVSWLLYVSQQMLAGDALYVDIVEVNPPLIAWMGIPIVALAQLTGLPIGASFKAFIFMLAAGSLLFSAKILRGQKSRNIGLILITATYAVTILPAFSFGQREHIMVMLCLPYLFAAAARAKNRPLPMWQIFLVSILAGIGFCIKPYFVFIPAVIEIFLLAKLKLATFRRPEPYIMVAVGILYLISIFVFTPEYTSNIIVYASEVYGAGHGYSSKKIILAIVPFCCVSIFGLMLLNGEKVRFENIPEEYLVLAFATLGCFAVYLAQFKGWVYHLYPAYALGTILFVAAVYHLVFAREFKFINLVRSTPLLGLIYIMAVFLVFIPKYNGYYSPIAKELKPVIAEFPDVTSVFIMTDNLDNGFPLITETGLQWGSRFPALWLTPGIQAKKAAGKSYPLLVEIEQYSHQSVAEDIARYKPHLIFVDVGEFKAFGGIKYDYISDYSQSEKFELEWSNYEFIRNVGPRALYKRVGQSN